MILMTTITNETVIKLNTLQWGITEFSQFVCDNIKDNPMKPLSKSEIVEKCRGTTVSLWMSGDGEDVMLISTDSPTFEDNLDKMEPYKL